MIGLLRHTFNYQMFKKKATLANLYEKYQFPTVQYLKR